MKIKNQFVNQLNSEFDDFNFLFLLKAENVAHSY